MPSFSSRVAKFINADVVKDAPVCGPIDRVEFKEMDGEEKGILFIKGEDRGLPLNATNSNFLIANIADDYDQWVGVSVELYHDMTTYKGKPVACVRIRMPQ